MRVLYAYACVHIRSCVSVKYFAFNFGRVDAACVKTSAKDRDFGDLYSAYVSRLRLNCCVFFVVYLWPNCFCK